MMPERQQVVRPRRGLSPLARPTDKPVVPCGIRDPALPHSVWLVSHRKDDLRAGGDRSVRHRVRIFDDETHTHARSAEGRRTDVERRWVLVNGVEALTVDRHLDDELPARARLARDPGRSERLLVELDGCARVLDVEEGRQRHARHISTLPLSWTPCTRRAAVANSPSAQHTATSASPP